MYTYGTHFHSGNVFFGKYRTDDNKKNYMFTSHQDKVCQKIPSMLLVGSKLG